ncbi:MAG: GHMP family kinase ATP-binding protein [Candidatus Latescibacterota bacterium]
MDSAPQRKPLRIINSAAPIRICDNGGWTDTWFAEHGKIFNIGVYPYAEVQIEVYPSDTREERIVINAENFGERYVLHPETSGWDRHPLLEAAIRLMGVAERFSFQVTIFSEAPGGASTGTSAAVTVALVGALDRLTPGRLTPHEAAYTAHSVEVDLLHLQCGIQDQLCSAYGGICYIEMFRYPHATVSPIQVPNAVWWELERRLALIYLGKSHSSSQVHENVIRDLEHNGPGCRELKDLRDAAARSRDAVYAGDFRALGRAMIDNTDAQARLHSNLVSADARRVIEIARAHGAVGWKVNGAGGDGGSVTILCDSLSPAKRAMIREIEEDNALFRNIPVYLSRHGLRTWEQEP